MTKTKTLFLICVLATLLISCQKEVSLQDLGGQGNGGGTNNPPGSNNGSITGTWNFVGLSAHTRSTVMVSAGGMQMKTVTVSDYDGKNNTGTITISASDFAFTNIGYSIDTTMHAKFYMDGVLVSDLEQPFEMVSPPTSHTTAYTRNNNDSLTLANGVFTMTDPSPSAPTATGPLGMRIGWAGDTLLLKIVNSFTKTIESGGTPAAFTGELAGTLKLKKQ